MTDPKSKTADSLRAPGTKKKLGLTVPPALRMPHEELIKAEEPQTPTPRTPPTPRTDATHPIAPARDFTRVANSIVRDVVPGGHFIGKSKQLYDLLYQRTRGAIIPVRRLTISKPALMKASGVGSERTLLKNLNHLKLLGLLAVAYTDGKHEGNSYEVFTPEEAGVRIIRTSPTPPTPPHARAELPPVPPVESGVRGVGSAPLDSSSYGELKTSSLKTNTEQSDDDEAFAKLRCAMKRATGREVPAAQLDELDELLTVEFQIAAGRTTVSSAPAFFAEHLRRRLFKKDKRQLDAETAATGQSAQVAAIGRDISKCPDCFGAGMFYPSGYENGVARCGHDKLKKESE